MVASLTSPNIKFFFAKHFQCKILQGCDSPKFKEVKQCLNLIYYHIISLFRSNEAYRIAGLNSTQHMSSDDWF